MFKFYDIAQNTDDWFNLRGGRLTSSKLGCVMANFGKSFGPPAKAYAVDIALEQITGNPTPSTYSNAHMERGHEEEVFAREEYENENFCDVTNGGFFASDFIGCSPDGLVDDNGLIEAKSHIPSVHYENVKRQSYNPAYKWQYIGNLKFTARDWIDCISYCHTYPIDKRLFTYRIHKKDVENEFNMIDERVDEFKKIVNECKENILNKEYSV